MRVNGGLVNVTNFNHEFAEADIEENLIYHNFDKLEKCSKCNLIIGTDFFENKSDCCNYFFLNGIEIFLDFRTLEELNLTCEEIQIKLLLE